MNKTDTEEEITDLSELVAADDGKDTVRVYEVGYHLVPTLSEDAVSAEVEALASALKKADVTVIGERAPVKVGLTYAMEKKVDGTTQQFNEGYFGWFAFETNTSDIDSLDRIFKMHPTVLRHLTIKTDRDTVASVLADPSLDVAPVEEEAVNEEESVPGEEGEQVVESVGADSEGSDETTSEKA